MFDKVMFKKLGSANAGSLDLSKARDVFTHSYHQDRYIELLQRSVEDNSDDIKSVRVRLINDQSFYQRHGYLEMKVSHFRRLAITLPDNRLTTLSLHLGKVSIQDN